MANLLVLDGAGSQKYVAKTGAGTNVDPFADPAPALPTGASTAAAQASILAAVDGVEVLLTAIDGHVDGIETALGGTLAVSGPVTDAQLRATPVPVSGTVTATTGGLTDTQLRATAVPVSGTVTANAATRTLTTVTGTRTTSGDGTAVIAAPGSGVKVVIVNFEINPKEATTTILLKSATTVKRTWTLAQNSLYANDYPRGHELRMGVNEAVYLNLDADSDTNYAIDYFQE